MCGWMEVGLYVQRNVAVRLTDSITQLYVSAGACLCILYGASRQQTAIRRGLFSATELEDWLGEDCPGLDRQCIIRFPPDIAATLRKRLMQIRHQQHTRASRGVSSAGDAPFNFPPGCTAANPLGLIITPREEWSYRIFDVKVRRTGCRRGETGVFLLLL